MASFLLEGGVLDPQKPITMKKQIAATFLTAAVVSASALTYDPAPATFGSTALGFSSALNVPGFVPGPGSVIDSVDIKVTTQIDGTVAIENISATQIAFYILYQSADFTASFPTSPVLSTLYTPVLFSGTSGHGPLSAYDGHLDFSGTSGDHINYSGITSVSSYNTTSPAAIAFFSSGLLVPVGVSGIQGGGLFVAPTTTPLPDTTGSKTLGTITIDLAYNYHLVSDGGTSMLLIGMAFTTLGFMRRRIV